MAQPYYSLYRYGRFITCAKLLDSTTGSSSVNETDGKGHAPIHAAASAGHVKVVQLLLARGAMCSK